MEPRSLNSSQEALVIGFLSQYKDAPVKTSSMSMVSRRFPAQ
jgi:hypothetical protein